MQQPQHKEPIPLPAAGPLGRYVRQTIYMLFITLPLSIVGFTLSVTLTALGFGLTPLLIGFPLLKISAYLSHALMMADARRIRALLPERYASALPSQHAFGPFTYKDLFTSSAPYLPLGYWLAKLPAAIIQFAVAVVLPVSGIAALLSPAIYLVLKQYGIEIYQDDVVFDTLLPMLSPLERSYIGSGIGLVFLLIGWSLLSRLTLVQANRAAALLQRQPKPAAQHAEPAAASYQPAASAQYQTVYGAAAAGAEMEEYSLDSLPFEPFDPNAPAPSPHAHSSMDELKAQRDALRQQLQSKLYPQ